MGHARELLSQWGGGGVILSPRDLDQSQLLRVARESQKAHAEVLLDPQCYAHDADHGRLVAHNYWKMFRSTSTNALVAGGFTSVLQELAALAQQLGVRRHILPGMLAATVDDDWLDLHEDIVRSARTCFSGEPVLATVALSCAALCDERQVESVVERAAQWNVDGYYVVAETPGPYLVDNPVWVANLLILVSGLQLTGRPVVVGYCNHQMLCLASAGASIIASGTWLNVRAFPPDKFYVADSDDISRRTIWYYCPQSLSEYKINFLDIALRGGQLNAMKPDPALNSRYADPLFAGPQPTSVQWGEQNSFRHYLTCLRSQTRMSRLPMFQATMDTHRRLLDGAEAMLRQLRANGVLGGDRDFMQHIDVNRSALTVLDNARGPLLRRKWQ